MLNLAPSWSSVDTSGRSPLSTREIASVSLSEHAGSVRTERQTARTLPKQTGFFGNLLIVAGFIVGTTFSSMRRQSFRSQLLREHGSKLSSIQRQLWVSSCQFTPERLKGSLRPIAVAGGQSRFSASAAIACIDLLCQDRRARDRLTKNRTNPRSCPGAQRDAAAF